MLGMLWLGAFLGALASGGAGFAFAPAASAVWLHVLDPVRVTLLIVASSVALQALTLWPLRRHLDRARLVPFLVGGVLGIPLGVALLTHSDPGALKSALGVFLIAFGSFALLSPRLPIIVGGGRVADGAIAFVGGILGGLGGYSGILPTIWTQLRGWPKDTARAVYQPFIMATQLVTLIIVGMVALDRTAALLFLLSVPALAGGAWLGWSIYGRLDERRFRQFLAVLLVLSGITLVI